MPANAASAEWAEDEFHLEIDSIVEEPDPDHSETPTPGSHASGAQLRRRFVTPESIADLAGAEKPSLLQRLLRRR
ncbi:hypothetical protein [Novosphingobium mangrovi (ex Huang et al. 2023)]|uniref:Transposase n=1 Tax=Novosphingobium mangrovi (ex Huang et al. 2023) TaxID=2976432 RepID=A0ABT2I6V6_9SPHN|nr:hypothetical protein [Novosphingobium mangrovi (ex Huang et al. 2023)]MCT2400555.1 hypothetical protein [Novosphingobium mangrovi (ex Huang et al. 2023)]